MADADAPKPKRKIVTRSRIAITKRTLDALKTPQRDCLLWDRSTKRFGVRLTPSGAISFVVQYRNPQGRSRRLTIGNYGTWTPAQAREEAERLLRVADAGGDPVRDRLEARNAITFRQLAEEYMEKAQRGLIVTRKRMPKKPGTVASDKYRIQHLVVHFGDKPVKDIVRVECQRCLEKLIEGRHGATRTFGLLGAVLSYAVDREYIALNPAHGVRKPADGRREFRLEQAGYHALGRALEAAEARAESWRAVTAIRLLALTGCRKGEILKLRLSEVDLQGSCLRLGDTKTGESVRALGGLPYACSGPQ